MAKSQFPDSTLHQGTFADRCNLDIDNLSGLREAYSKNSCLAGARHLFVPVEPLLAFQVPQPLAGIV